MQTKRYTLLHGLLSLSRYQLSELIKLEVDCLNIIVPNKDTIIIRLGRSVCLFVMQILNIWNQRCPRGLITYQLGTAVEDTTNVSKNVKSFKQI